MSFYRKPLGVAFGRIARAALRCVPLFLLVFAVMADSYGQSGGSIRGHVKNLATGKYLTNAQVVLEGTNRSTYTDQYGEYRFNNVPAGDVTVTASYVGLGQKSINVTVDQGVTSASDIALFEARAGRESEDVFELEAFTVDGSDFDSNAIAQQERKTSSNLKLVQHADALGEIAEGNIGEFLKNMPGVAIDYVAADARSIKLRGMGSEFTTVTVDGASMASAGSSGKIRQFELEQVSLTNIEQLEITKLPRPDNPANSMGGSVNLVSKNAFAQGGRKITYKAYLNFNSSKGFDLNDSPGWAPDSERSKTNPSFELGYSDVFLNDRLGASFTFSQSNQFNIQQRFQWNGDYREFNDGTFGNERLQIQDGPKFSFRQSVAANFDYKATENTIVTLRSQVNWYDAEFSNRNYNWAISTDMANSHDGHLQGPYNTSSSIGGSHRNKYGDTYHVDLGVKHTFGDWKIDYGATKSVATNHYRDFKNGYAEGVEIKGFNSLTKRLAFDFDDMTTSYTDITGYDATSGGNVVDNYGLPLDRGTLNYLRSRPNDSKDDREDLRVNVTRDLDIGENKITLKAGIDRASQHRESINKEMRYTTNAGAAIKTKPVSDFLDEVYYDQSPGFGYGSFVWPSQGQIYDYYVAHPSEFTYSQSTALSAQQNSYLNLDEIITSYYVMASVGFAGDRGMFTTGVRREDTDLTGRFPVGPVKKPDPNDPTKTITTESTYLDENGDIAGAFENVDLSYETYHPSAHLRYNITDKLIARLSYANTIGRPNFGNMFGPTTVTFPSDDPTELTLNLKNPNLKPRRSNNVDFTLEYYFGETSMVSASVFQNEIKDFEGKSKPAMSPESAAAVGIEYRPEYAEIDYISAPFTAGDATVKGLELNWNQALAFGFVPEFLKASSVYANGTFLDLEGRFDGTDYASFTDTLPGFAKETISYGFIFDKKPFSLKFRWNIRGEETQSGTRNYKLKDTKTIVKPHILDERRVTLDVNGDYAINDRMSFFFSVKNATDAPYRLVVDLGEVSNTHERALYREEQFGAQWSLGVKGKF